MKVIVISGKSGSGKTTTANIIKKELERADYRVLKISYADILKFICQKYFGWNGKKNEFGRDLLQYMGTDVIRKKSPDYFVNHVCELLKIFENERDYAVIDDARFPNEIDMLKEYDFDCIHIRTVRPNYKNKLNKAQSAHPSETALDRMTPDEYILNDKDLHCLAKNVQEFVQRLIAPAICTAKAEPVKTVTTKEDKCNDVMITKDKDGVKVKNLTKEESKEIFKQYIKEYEESILKMQHLFDEFNNVLGVDLWI